MRSAARGAAVRGVLYSCFDCRDLGVVPSLLHPKSLNLTLKLFLCVLIQRDKTLVSSVSSQSSDDAFLNDLLAVQLSPPGRRSRKPLTVLWTGCKSGLTDRSTSLDEVSQADASSPPPKESGRHSLPHAYIPGPGPFCSLLLTLRS